MVGILSAFRRSRGNRRRDTRTLKEQFTALLGADDAALQQAREEFGEDVVVVPRLVLPRVFAFVAMALCVALLGGFVMSLDNYNLRTRQFHLCDVEVVGNHRLAPDEVIAASGIAIGHDLFGIDKGQVRRRLEALPWVRQARVRTKLPATLVLEVEEYVPVVLVAGGELFLADDACHLIARPKRGAHLTLPNVTGIAIADLQRDPPNAASLLARRRLRRAIDLVGAWPHSDRFALGEVNWDAVRGFTLMAASDGAELRIGHATGAALQRRFEQIDALLRDVEKRALRLRYALLDDQQRPGNAIIQTTTEKQWTHFPRLRRQVRPAGPSRALVPQGRSKVSPDADKQQDRNSAERARQQRARSKASKPGGR